MDDNILTAAEQKADFDRICNDPKRWRQKAHDLLVAGSILHEAYDNAAKSMAQHKEGEVPEEFWVLEPALMLQSFAAECLLKALFLRGGGLLAKDGKFLERRTHELVDWCTTVSLDIPEAERRCLKTLSLIATSYGRYPVPIYWDKNPVKKGKRGFSPRYQWSSADCLALDDFLQKCSAEYEKRGNCPRPK